MAKFTRKKIETSKEENILIGVIMSTKFCRDFNSMMQDDLTLLKSKYLRIPIEWSLEYFKAYKKAPEGSILDIYMAEKSNLSKEDAEFVEEALTNVNQKYVEEGANFDVDYYFQQTELYIRKRNLEDNCDKIKGLLSQDKILSAENEHAQFKRIENGETVGIDIFSDSNAVDDMFVEEESVFRMNGALGELLGEVYYGDLVYVGGPSKASKTWTSMELAIACVESGLNVLWLSLEMSATLMNKRFASRIAGGSFKTLNDKIYIPRFTKDGNIDYTKEKIKKLDPKTVKRKYKLFKRQCGNGKLVVHDMTTAGNTVNSIKNIITTAEEFEGIKYNVIFVDQLNLIKTFGVKEKRHALDTIALELKREIAQDLHTLVVSPVQYNRESLKKNLNDEASISEAYSLFTHCSLLLSINQTREERERGLVRYTASGRHSNYSGVVLGLQCLDLGRAVMESRWLKDVPNYNDIVKQYDFNEEDEIDLSEV